MSQPPHDAPPSTTEAARAVTQTRTSTQPRGRVRTPQNVAAGLKVDYEIGPKLQRAVYSKPYERKAGDPLYRPLKIYTLDPSVSRFDGAVAVVNVPYEPLNAGPAGQIFAVVDSDGTKKIKHPPVDLEDRGILIRNGRTPSPSDAAFHQQMVYAVCSLVYAAFRTALGRHVTWGFDRKGENKSQLLIRPHAFEGRNAYYQKDGGELCFGYYPAAQKVAGRNLPNGVVFTCLSHDIIAHEVTHALLDGLRTRFMFPSNPDVLAFHEAFADLVAIFQHFSYSEVLQIAIRKSRGNLRGASLITDIARQFNQTISGQEKALRSAIDVTDEDKDPKPYCPEAGSHELGSVLVSAVFEAFTTVFKRKTERYLRLANNGIGETPAGNISAELETILAGEASKLASQFLTICIRAIDYCPPTDLMFGDYLRAMITADHDLVPDDPWGYREALIDAFRRRQIYPNGVENLSEEELLWKAPDTQLPPIRELTFAELRFEGDPALPASDKELRRQACALGRIVTQKDMMESFGLERRTGSGNKSLGLPRVQSIRSSRRVGPDGQIIFDLIAEVTQRKTVRSAEGDEFDMFGGATIIIDPRGEIRYIISKAIRRDDRVKEQHAFLLSETGRDFWQTTGQVHEPKPGLFQLMHAVRDQHPT